MSGSDHAAHTQSGQMTSVLGEVYEGSRLPEDSQRLSNSAADPLSDYGTNIKTLNEADAAHTSDANQSVPGKESINESDEKENKDSGPDVNEEAKEGKENELSSSGGKTDPTGDGEDKKDSTGDREDKKNSSGDGKDKKDSNIGDEGKKDTGSTGGTVTGNPDDQAKARADRQKLMEAKRAEEQEKKDKADREAAAKHDAAVEKGRKAAEEKKKAQEKVLQELKEANKAAEGELKTAKANAEAAKKAADEELQAAKETAKQEAEAAKKAADEELQAAKETAKQEAEAAKKAADEELQKVNDKAKAAEEALKKLLEQPTAVTIKGEDGSVRTLKEWKAEWEKNAGARFMLPEEVRGRQANVLEENSDAWRTAPELSDAKDKFARDQLVLALPKWNWGTNAFLKPETTEPSDSFVWLRTLEEQPRLQLTLRSSIDPSEVVCPPGMVVVGVGLGPWMGIDATTGERAQKITNPVHMSIKLLCLKPGEKEPKLFGNKGPKITIAGDRMAGGERDNPGGHTNTPPYTPWPPSKLSGLYCDARPVTYERFAKPDDGGGTKAICSLSFYRFRPPARDNRFGLLPTWQNPRWPRISPTPEAIDAVYTDAAVDSLPYNYFRRDEQVDNSANNKRYTTTGIDRLWFDTNIISYQPQPGEYWQVTGVQLYLKDKDTIALNVRFHPDHKLT